MTAEALAHRYKGDNVFVPADGGGEKPLSLHLTRGPFVTVAGYHGAEYSLADGLPETLWIDGPWLGRVLVLNDGILKLWKRSEGADLLDRSTPAQSTGRRIMFAGEHMGQASSGMEAALESCDRCVAALAR